jgi:hypothetical protein
VLQSRPAVQRETKPPTALQITQHGFGNNLNRFLVSGPFQLLLTARQVLQRIFEPQQISVSLAHRTPGPSIVEGLLLMPMVHRNRCAMTRGKTIGSSQAPDIQGLVDGDDRSGLRKGAFTFAIFTSATRQDVVIW